MTPQEMTMSQLAILYHTVDWIKAMRLRLMGIQRRYINARQDPHSQLDYRVWDAKIEAVEECIEALNVSIEAAMETRNKVAQKVLDKTDERVQEQIEKLFGSALGQKGEN